MASRPGESSRPKTNHGRHSLDERDGRDKASFVGSCRQVSGSDTNSEMQVEQDEDVEDVDVRDPKAGEARDAAFATRMTRILSRTRDKRERNRGRDKPPDHSLLASAMDIEYRYFSFTTPLPTPNTTSALSPAPPPPPPPDLRPFIDPHLWPDRRKNIMLALSCIATSLAAYSAGSFSPPSQRMAEAFGRSQMAMLCAGITVFCLGFGLAPMLLAPLSETNGRYPVFVVSGIVTVIAHIMSGTAPNYATILVARLLVGMGSSVFSTMVGGIIADMWHAAGRNTPMALFSGFVLIGTGIGPLVCSKLVYHTTYPLNPADNPTNDSLTAPWRWVFWHQAIGNAVLLVLLATFFSESRGSVLLSRKAAALNRWYEQLEALGYYGVWMLSETEDGDLPQDPQIQQIQMQEMEDKDICPATLHRVRWLVKDDEDRTTVLHMMAVSMYRPFHMLFSEPVVFFFSLWVSFAWGLLYLQFGSTFLVFQSTYNWNMEVAGRAFSAQMVGGAIATAVGITQDRLLARIAPRILPARFHDPTIPERRLYVACISSVLLPIGMFIFGWTARPDVHWIAPMFGTGLATFGIFAVYLSTFNYLADVYHRFASSALAAQSFCRNIIGGVFALLTRPLFINLGTPAASSLLGGVALLLTLVPWVLVFFGQRIRSRSKFAMALNES